MTFLEFTRSCFNAFDFRHQYQVQQIKEDGTAKILYYGPATDERWAEFQLVKNMEIKTWLITKKGKLVVITVE